MGAIGRESLPSLPGIERFQVFQASARVSSAVVAFQLLR